MKCRTPPRFRCGVLRFCGATLLAACMGKESPPAHDGDPPEPSIERAQLSGSGQGAPGDPPPPPSTDRLSVSIVEGDVRVADALLIPSDEGIEGDALPAHIGTLFTPTDLIYELEPTPLWRSGAVETTEPSALLEGGELTLWRQAWRSPSASGWVWWVSAPRNTLQQVVSAASLRSFGDIISAPSASDWAAINGGFYDGSMLAGFRPMGLVLSDGVEQFPFARGGGSGVYYVRHGRAEIAHRSAWPVAGASQALQSIDRIVDADVSLVRSRRGARAAARSGLLVTADEVRLVVAVAAESLGVVSADGQQLQQTSYHGLTLAEFADYLVSEHGAESALNLDGAVSTQLYVSINSIAFRLLGERGTINAIQLSGRPR